MLDQPTTLPGAEIVLPGIEDAKANRSTVNALAVQMAATRLRASGLDVPETTGDRLPSHELYRLLADELGDAAHSRYNAIIARIVSFCRAAERARSS